MSDYSPRGTLNGAKCAAWKYTPKALEHWREDIVSDVVLRALEDRARKGVPTSAEGFKWGVLHAVRRLSYLLRGQSEALELADAEVVDAPSELGPIALWRLQAAWPDLTDVERLALSMLVTDSSPVETARAVGLQRTALNKARQTALARIDNPKAATSRGRSHRTRWTLADAKPADPAQVAAWKERERLKAYGRRDRQRAREATP